MRTGRSSTGLWTLGILCAALLAVPTGVSRADQKQPKPLKIVGIATEITPSTLTVHGQTGEITIQTHEDFTEKLAPGSEVTAWYYQQDGGEILQWLEYPLESFFIPRNEFPPALKKVIILPNSTVQDAGGLLDAIANFMETRLGYYVAPRMLAEEIRNRALKAHSTMDAIDPATGAVDISTYTQAQRNLIQHLASETRVDAVFQADVELVQAEFRSLVASWDGVHEPVAGTGKRTLGFFAPILNDGHVPAATVVLKLWDPNGRLLWCHRRGFAVLARMTGVGGKFRDRPIAEVLQNSDGVREWLEALFAAFLPAQSGENTALTKP
jgi:hypothetical protein